MGRGGKVQNKKNGRRRIPSRCKGSDESDEDYTVGEDEELNYYSEDEESRESFGEFEEEEEVRKVGRPKGGKAFRSRKKFGGGKVRKRSRVSYRLQIGENLEDQDHGDDDGEFAPDEIGSNEEDELAVQKKKDKVPTRSLRKKSVFVGRKRKRNYGIIKKPMRKKSRKRRRLLRKSTVGNGGAYKKKKLVITERRSKKNTGQRKKKIMAESDSDFVSSGSSDYEYAISEEEKEQVRQASEFCRDLTTGLRNSSSTKIVQEEGILCQQRKHSGRKGKEKVDDLNNETGKQFCGICLSEEGKKTVRGTLSCCNHFFCFACIMEWSKVESRCPLCKQRFVTIGKPARSDMGFDLRATLIQIPERDQVYQPSEEELRGYLYPYDNSICTECHQSGDDALMLLCDLCDSPAHTYCVGLGHDVPEGSWYCEVCRPAALGSSNVQAPNLTVHQLSGRSSAVGHVREDIDLNSAYVPERPLGQGSGVLISSRRSVGNFHAAAPVSGIGVLTVSERRRIQHQVHNLLNNSIISQLGGRNGMPAATPRNGLSGYQPTTLGSADQQTPNLASDQRTVRELSGRSSPIENVREDVDLNSSYVPETPLDQGSGVISSPRRSAGNFQAASPVSGTEVLTVSERRRIQHQIHHLLNNTVGQLGGRNGMPATTPGNNLSGSQIEQRSEVGFQNAMIPQRFDSHRTFSHGRSQENFTPPTLGRDLFSARSSYSRGQLLQGQTSNSADTLVNGMPESGVAGISGVINSRSGQEQIHPYTSRSSNVDDSMASGRYRDTGHFTAQKEQVQSLVRSHLKTLSRRMVIGYSTFKEIARSSTHTILAVCDLEHRPGEVYPVQPPRKCNHHVEGTSGEARSLMKDCCTSCFDSFVKNVVWEIASARVPSVA